MHKFRQRQRSHKASWIHLLDHAYEGVGWSYDGDYGLTLDGAKLESIFLQPYAVGGEEGLPDWTPTTLKVELKGNNKVRSISHDNPDRSIFSISGDGSLEAELLDRSNYQTFLGGLQIRVDKAPFYC